MQRDFSSLEQFLDNDGRAGASESFLYEHLVNGSLSLGERFTEQNAFAQGKPVGLYGAAAA